MTYLGDDTSTGSLETQMAAPRRELLLPTVPLQDLRPHYSIGEKVCVRRIAPRLFAMRATIEDRKQDLKGQWTYRVKDLTGELVNDGEFLGESSLRLALSD